MPDWVKNGYHEYSKRFPADFQLNLIEISNIKRTKNSDLNRIKEIEAEEMLAKIPKNSLVVALDEHGTEWNTQKLAKELQRWRENWQNISLLIGGPEGLAKVCLEKAEIKWSLSTLTFPHPLVRIIVAEQIYRAWSILSKHPYHK